MRLVLVLAPDRLTRDAAATRIGQSWLSARGSGAIHPAPPAVAWPFTYPLTDTLPKTPTVLWTADLHEAFVNHQTAGTRLVTTQAAYLMQEWIDAVEERDIIFVASADAGALAQHAPEVPARRGAFANMELHDLSMESPSNRGEAVGRTPVNPPSAVSVSSAGTTPARLAAAFRAADAASRLRLCVEALDAGRTPAALVATASACMEVNDLEGAARDLDEAIGLAPDWAAAHFERGKLWLRLDELEHASAAFRVAAERMPGFGSAWANLGATLGELDRPDRALEAFERALSCDPASPQTLNNIGVVNRELGRLAESEAAFRRVIALSPDLAFGHYSLGHTLFLQGRYRMALSAYLEGQKRDAERNPVQASRLALCRLASGDAAGALTDLQRATASLPRANKQQVLADTSAVAWALLTHRPDVPGWRQVTDWLSAELAYTKADP